MVKCDGEFDDAKSRAKMAAGARNRIDQFVAQFGGELWQIGFTQLPQVLRHPDPVEQRGGTGMCHINLWN